MLNLDPEERDRFTALADEWWDAEGPSRTLHDINPCRLGYITDQFNPGGAVVADIGCGGGILSEALAEAGARVTGIDASAELIDIARSHARTRDLDIDYLCRTSDELAGDRPGSFDAVVCMELIEHVPDPDALIADCSTLLRPGGTLVVSTLNRTPRAYGLGIVAAEYLLALVPRGTHDYTRFVRPSELAHSARAHALVLRDVSGMTYNPVTRRARLSSSTSVNYFATFVHTAA